MRLKKYKKKHADPLECSVTTKLTKMDYKRFKDYLRDLNLTEAEAVRYLIQDELASLDNDASHTDSQLKATTNPKRYKFSSKEWQVDKKLPCVFCDSWHLAKNMARHLKRHGYDSIASYLTENEKEASEMKEEKIKKKR